MDWLEFYQKSPNRYEFCGDMILQVTCEKIQRAVISHRLWLGSIAGSSVYLARWALFFFSPSSLKSWILTLPFRFNAISFKTVVTFLQEKFHVDHLKVSQRYISKARSERFRLSRRCRHFSRSEHLTSWRNYFLTTFCYTLARGQTTCAFCIHKIISYINLSQRLRDNLSSSKETAYVPRRGKTANTE